MPEITKIEEQKKRPGRVNIYLDGEFAIGASEKLVVDFDLYKGKVVTEEEVEKLKIGESAAKCLDAAYRFLSYRPRTEKEMRDKLSEKYDPELVEETIGKLKKYHYIDDAEFARIWVGDRAAGRSAKALSFELKKKGVAMDVIEEAVATIDRETEHAHALQLVKGKEKYRHLSGNEAYQKIGGFLARRGYGYDIIKKVIKELEAKE